MTVEELIAELQKVADQDAFVELPNGNVVAEVDTSNVDGGHYVVLR